jgi:hypothetical protein
MGWVIIINYISSLFLRVIAMVVFLMIVAIVL